MFNVALFIHSHSQIMDRTTLNVKIESPIYKELHSLATSKSISKTKIIEKALAQYLNMEHDVSDTTQNEESLILRNEVDTINEAVVNLRNEVDAINETVANLRESINLLNEDKKSSILEPEVNPDESGYLFKTKETTTLNVKQLANRLGVTAPTVDYQRKQNADSFREWTRLHDPKGISWDFYQVGHRYLYFPPESLED